MLSRHDWLAELFPTGIPRLWCPLITHVRAARTPDPERTARHLRILAPHVKGLLIPGSTGEGWEMSDAEALNVLDGTLNALRGTDIRVLIGVLKTTVPDMLAGIEATKAWLCQRAGTSDWRVALQQLQVVGWTVCAAKGADRTQTEIESGLRAILDLGLPTALYQLPQVTENEMAPEVVQRLANDYPNFVLFKDTSGADRVAQSGLDFGGVYLVRGAEGGYSTWPRSNGGVYDGFLLSSANNFGAALAEMLQILEHRTGKPQLADAIAGRVDRMIRGAFEIVAGFPAANAFANANKVLDHLFAHGADALRVEPPFLFGGVRLPREFIERAKTMLVQETIMPERGYLMS